MARSLLLIIGVTLACWSCKKPVSQLTGGGTGGTSILAVTAEHSDSLIDSCTVYIKYGTSDAPANGIYDDSAVTIKNGTIPYAKFSGLKIGIYYLLGVGYHKGYAQPNLRGGIPCAIRQDHDSVHVYLPTYSQ